ncbi:hypothetical protein KSF_044470 [Reticulibacter mediterranei]|uniref:Uncharacterized protein n=1 Tax=Reticulibacter mediterranei TaxID=2778369 RepID=A0A8J3IMN9_9CHLR|nr:hypothetical protein [Reticulibacter mediterranei]GHO94399.1 hypothetical protein KSF_044470 [Reticulibacter mediterranei]
METRLLGYEHAASMTEISAWANGLIGKELPEFPQYQVIRIIHFQALATQNGYDVLLLVEVVERPEETEQIAIRAEDIAVIEELTSTVGKEPANGTEQVG